MVIWRVILFNFFLYSLSDNNTEIQNLHYSNTYQVFLSLVLDSEPGFQNTHLPAELLKDGVHLLCKTAVDTTDLTSFVTITHVHKSSMLSLCLEISELEMDK